MFYIRGSGSYADSVGRPERIIRSFKNSGFYKKDLNFLYRGEWLLLEEPATAAVFGRRCEQQLAYAFLIFTRVFVYITLL